MRPGFVIVAALGLACSTSAKDGNLAGSGRDKMPAATEQPARPRQGPKVHLTTPRGEVTVDVEVVATEPAIERGLMFRQHMPPDEGMLFLMTEERDWTFWMRNTLIPLDMIFITKDLTIAGIVQNAVPRTETLRSVGAPSVYVLEVNGGWTASHGVAAGAKVRFEGVQPTHR